MSRYGITIYGTDFYGERSTLQYATSLVLREHNYTTIRVSLSQPPGGAYNRLRIVRSLSGPPVSAYDEGRIIWDSGEQINGPAVDTKIATLLSMPGYIALDQFLSPGRWAYYSVFVYAVENEDTGEGEWYRLDTQAILVPTYYNGTQTMWDMLPTILKNPLVGAVDEEYTQNDDLASFMGVFGFRLDILRSLVASTADIRNPYRVAYQLVEPAIEDLGTPFEEALGPEQMRRFLTNQSYFYKKKGTVEGARGVTIATTGYATEVTVSGNLVWAENFSNGNYDTTDGSPLTDVGTWGCRDGSGWTVLAAAGGGFYLSPARNTPAAQVLATMGPATDPTVAQAPSADCLQSAIPVHPGLFYTCGMTIPNRFGGADAAILWLDNSGTLINQVTATDSSGTASFVVAQAPESAAYAIPAIQWDAVQVSDDAVWQNVFFTETPDPEIPATYEPPNRLHLNLIPARVNLVTNPSFTVDTTGWTEFGAATLTRTAQSPLDTQANVNPAEDDWHGQIVLNGPGTLDGGIYCQLRTRAGVRYVLQFDRNQPVFTGARFGLAVSDVPGDITTAFAGQALAPLPDSYVFGAATPFAFTAKGSTTFLYIEINGPSNTTFNLDQLIVEETNLGVADLLPYFDADVFNVYDEYDWSGTPNASESYYYPQRSVRIPRLQDILPRYLYFGQSFDINFGLSGILGYVSDTVVVSRVSAPEATSVVGRAIDLEWRIYLEGSNAISLEWDLIGPGSNAITLGWADHRTVDSTATLRSNDDQTVGATVTPEWRYALPTAGQQINLEWADNADAGQTVTPEWNVAQSTSPTTVVGTQVSPEWNVAAASPLPFTSTAGDSQNLYNAGRILGVDITVVFNGPDTYKAIVFGANGVEPSGGGDGSILGEVLFTNNTTYFAIYSNGSYPVNNQELTNDGGYTAPSGTFRVKVSPTGFITAYYNGTFWGSYQLSSAQIADLGGDYVGYGTYDQNVSSITVKAWAPAAVTSMLAPEKLASRPGRIYTGWNDPNDCVPDHFHEKFESTNDNGTTWTTLLDQVYTPSQVGYQGQTALDTGRTYGDYNTDTGAEGYRYTISAILNGAEGDPTSTTSGTYPTSLTSTPGSSPGTQFALDTGTRQHSLQFRQTGNGSGGSGQAWEIWQVRCPPPNNSTGGNPDLSRGVRLQKGTFPNQEADYFILQNSSGGQQVDGSGSYFTLPQWWRIRWVNDTTYSIDRAPDNNGVPGAWTAITSILTDDSGDSTRTWVFMNANWGISVDNISVIIPSFFTETFPGASGDALPFEWVVNGSVFQDGAGHAAHSGSNNSNYTDGALRDTNHTDHKMTATLGTYTSGSPLLAVRCTDFNDGYFADRNGIYKRVGGAFTALVGGTNNDTIPWSQGDVLVFEVDGAALSLTRNGTVERTVSDNSITTGTQVGFAWDSSADNATFGPVSASSV